MGLRHFLATVLLGYEPVPKPKPPRYWQPSDPIELLRHDASLLMRRAYDDRPRSRADMLANGRMTHSRWTAAFRFLVGLDILDKHGRINGRRAPDVATAEALLKDGIARRKKVEAAGKFVSPYPTRRRP